MSRRHHDPERGAVLVLFSVMMVVMLGLAAIIVDLGGQRSNGRDLQSIADLASLGGGKSLSNGNVVQACRDAVTYVNTNVRKESLGINAVDFCSQAGAHVGSTSCSVSGGVTQVKPTITAGSYTLILTYPVLASDMADSHYSGPGLNDGTACQRMGVRVAYETGGVFSNVLGVSRLRTSRMAVVRQTSTESRRTPSLWLLDPTGCHVLTVGGSSSVHVGTVSPLNPGVITVDSNGTTNCGGSSHVVETGGAGSSITAVPTTGATQGNIDIFALPVGSDVCVGTACDPGAVASGTINPQPTPSVRRATRAPVDWVYNCKASYPTFHGIEIVACPDAGVRPAYVDSLRAAIGISGLPPGGFSRWQDTHSCLPSGTIVVPAGNWWVDCPSGLSIGNGTDLTFSGGNLVLDGGIKMTGGSLRINTANPTPNLVTACLPPAVSTPCLGSSSAQAAFVYQRGGNLELNGGSPTFRNVTLIQQAGYLGGTAGSPPVWSAPAEGPFRGLALWSENGSSNKYQINGGASMDLSGVFFTPEATFSINGGSPVNQQRAQFISYQLSVSGGANLRMAPDQVNHVSIPPTGGRLIR